MSETDDVTSRAVIGAPGYVNAEDKAKVLTRLKRIEGQVRGLQRLVDEDTYCTDVLTQVAAVTGALQGVAITLVRDHVQHCVTNDLQQGDDTSLDEVMKAITRLVR